MSDHKELTEKPIAGEINKNVIIWKQDVTKIIEICEKAQKMVLLHIILCERAKEYNGAYDRLNILL
jgi:hypothetical protein